ncbi:sugar transport 8-like [Olea europaea subsp. europaea]|uniref:Sugar transport 8-like n=1 Tax=Olea europaea subsp. europaea TaxID=158383 RepID=A0A8S0T8K2_OLEEU|nr:sugar transport 8-like [Olea europaea subsp. europaea]
MFGYDIGISGGVTSMDDFLKMFFPAVLKGVSLLDRKPTIGLASILFILGAIVSGLAPNKALLIIGRILFGIGVGFGNESVPLFLSEVAPMQHRGAVNILFQFFVTIGILVANLVNYAVSSTHPNGWRIALGLAGVPAVFLFIGSLIISETPSSLIERGKEFEGKEALRKIRGLDDVESELEQIKLACEIARQVKHPYRKLFKRASMPPLIIRMSVQVFQQFTGINAIMFYAPVLFQTVGFKSDSSLLSAVITAIVNVLSTIVSIVAVDRVGRRKLLLQACMHMFISMVAIGSILLTHLKPTGSLDKGLAAVVVVLVCLFVMSFAWSWGPMGWLIPSETFPSETRTTGFAFAVSANMLFTFIIALAFLSMSCNMRAYIFFFFAIQILIMGLFVVFLLPETKGVPIDCMTERVWKKHPVWKKFMGKEVVKNYEMT